MTPSRFVRIARQRIRLLAQPRHLDREIERELALHLDLLAQEKRAEGLSDEAARREARREFGDVARLAERSRDARGLTFLSDLHQDARYGLRMLRRSPGFTTIASLALALGIGATAAVTGAIGLVLARPLPFPQSDRLVTIQTFADDGALQRGAVSVRDYFAWRERSGPLGQIGAAASGPRAIGSDPGGAPADQVPGQAFTPSLFAALGVRPQAGRLFDETDDPYSKTALVVVISHRLWQRRYSGAADTIGRTMIVDGAPRRIAGVMGPDFRYPNDATELWTPLIFAKDPALRSAERQLAVTGRLKQGVTVAQAQAELGSAIRVVPLREALYGWTKPRLLTLGAAVVLVLILACANVAGLLLARASMRRREVAVRIALGATRGRIVRQLVTESLVLGLGAGTLGVLVAWPGLAAVRAALGPPPGAPGVAAIDLDAWVLVAIVALSVLSSLVCGLVPALAEVRPRRGRGRYRLALVCAQFALAEVLLIGAALMWISFLHVNGRVMNVDTRGLLSFDYTVRPGEFVRPAGGDGGVPAFHISPLGSQTIDRVYDRLRRVSGAGDVAGISYPPVNSVILPTLAVRAEGARTGVSADPVAAYFVVTPNLFATLRTPIVRGREFDARDTATTPWTIVVNETLARLCWPGQDPIGRRVRLDAGPDEQPREVVGVVADVPPRRDRPAPQPVVYTPYLQHPARYRGRAPGMFGGMTFVMRPTGEKAAVLAAAREGVGKLTPERPIVNVGTLERHFRALMPERRNYVAALVAFALAASALAAMGLYGTMAYEIHGRTGELAVRKALGARRRDLVATMGRPAWTIVGAGILTGLAIAAALTPLLAPQLWGITATDPATFASMSLLLLGGAVLGCVVPLRRGLAVDPAARLRAE
ncbi:MAG TPA: ADOP family duplicated permease [Vicinamibacterales bacterium]|nr:ADOP family duplicated permease [Vicinamibacterales bacterium]